MSTSPAVPTTDSILPEHFASPVPHPAVAPLRAPATESGYRNVYRTARDRNAWVAKVRVLGRLTRLKGSASPLPHQAALHAALWYRDRYGANWRTALSGRATGGNHPAWRVWCVRQARLVSAPSRRGFATRVWRRGWAARVWEFGAPVEVTGRRKPGRRGETFDTLADCRLARGSWKSPGRLLVFATKDEAEAAVRAWIRQRWGLFAEAAVYRW